MNRRIEDIQNVVTLLEQDDYSWALKLGHQLKGNAVTFEFPQMAHIGMEIERAAKKCDKERVKILTQRMEDFINHAKENFPVEKSRRREQWS